MINNFRNSLKDAGNLITLHQHCVSELKLPGDYSDLLRMSVIYCMSALDKLIHDIIVHEMVEIYAGRRPPTPRYKSESISLEQHIALAAADSAVPPAAIVFEGIVRTKLSHLSFMDPSKLAEGLSLVWSENHKWQVIAGEIGCLPGDVKTELSNLYRRRNAIVHETDWDPSTGEKQSIEPIDAVRTQGFISDLGETIIGLV